MRDESPANRVRVIKRGTLRQPEALPEAVLTTAIRVDEEKTSRRDLAATVARWIGEVRERKDAEMKQALGVLLRKSGLAILETKKVMINKKGEENE